MTITTMSREERDQAIAKTYLEDSTKSLRAVGEQFGLGVDRTRLILLEVSGLSSEQIAEVREKDRIQRILKEANRLLDEDENITRTSDLFPAMGVSMKYVRSRQDQLQEVIERIKLRRNVKSKKATNKFSDEDILDAIRAAYHRAQDAVKEGKLEEFKYFTLPLYEAFRDEDAPTRATIISRIGWNEACERIGEFPHIKSRGGQKRITREDALNALRACSKDLDKHPQLITVRDYDMWHKDHPEHPYVLSIRKLFDRSWKNAAEALVEEDNL